MTDNRVAALPATIGQCTQLQKLMLAGNQLRDLPVELAACTQLELMRIAANSLTALPAWLLAMPRLAWLAYAGNPFSADDETAAAAHPPTIAWKRLTVAHQLGEGASGVISEAVLQAADGANAFAVAVKLFKGAMTSDGLPQCELAACISAGSHPNLIPVLGEITGRPDGVHGCVMTLIDPAFRTLAGPPSFDSCTRDVYPPATRFPLDALLRLASGIASAAAHLHGRGILHGDLYAHNILYTDDGNALLGDFGAASFTGTHALALQRLEVRAFGVLLGELIARCDTNYAAAAALSRLQQLSDVCLQTDLAARPSFNSIAAQLHGLQQAQLSKNLTAGNSLGSPLIQPE